MTNKMVTDRLVVNRYTKALFALLQENGQADVLWKDFMLIQKVLDNSPKARAVVSNHFIPAAMQMQFLQLIKDNSDISKISYNFIKTLIDNHRLYLFSEIKKSLLKSLQIYNNELEVKVISNIKLDNNQIEEISEILQKKFNKKIICDNKVDAEILGGVVIKIGSKMIDCSLSSKLNSFINESKQQILTLNEGYIK